MPTARVLELEKAHVPKHFSGDHGFANAKTYVSIERTRHYTQSWKQTEGQPSSLRRAKALAYHLDNMKISIRPGELIIGNYSADPFAMQFAAETSESEWAKEIVTELASAEDKKE